MGRFFFFIPLVQMAAKKDSKLVKAGVSGYNKPKKTPSHPTKSHVVVAKKGSETKLPLRATRSEWGWKEPYIGKGQEQEEVLLRPSQCSRL